MDLFHLGLSINITSSAHRSLSHRPVLFLHTVYFWHLSSFPSESMWEQGLSLPCILRHSANICDNEINLVVFNCTWVPDSVVEIKETDDAVHLLSCKAIRNPKVILWTISLTSNLTCKSHEYFKVFYHHPRCHYPQDCFHYLLHNLLLQPKV